MVSHTGTLAARQKRIAHGNRVAKIAIVVVAIAMGVALMLQPSIDEVLGSWDQHNLAAETDRKTTRYAAAVSSAYAAVHSEMEALLSFEVGALPTTVDGIIIGLGGGLPARQPAIPSVPEDPDAGSHTQTLEQTQLPTVFEGGTIRIPSIAVNQAIVEGVARADLRRGPGHYPGTPLPGQVGNVVISGHRTTYTQPFHDLDRLDPGSVIWIDTRDGSFKYVVEGFQIVDPSNLEPLMGSERAMLTLTTCNPKGSARERLVVVAGLAGDQPVASGQ